MRIYNIYQFPNEKRKLKGLNIMTNFLCEVRIWRGKKAFDVEWEFCIQNIISQRQSC